VKHRLKQWGASLRERQVATSIALVCLLLIVIVSIWPDIFQSASSHDVPQQSGAPEATPSVAMVKPGPAEPSVPASSPVATISPRAAESVSRSATDASSAASHHAPPKVKAATTAIQKSASKPPTLKTPPLPTGYYVQVGAFSDRKRAEAMQQKVRRAGWPVYIMPKAKGLLGVVIGPYPSRKQAGQQQQKILQQLKLKGYPIQHTS